MKCFFTRLCRPFFADTRGAVAPAAALIIPVVIAAVGLSVDTSRMYTVHDRLARSLDAAALAAVASGGSQSAMEERFNDYFQANYPEAALGDPMNLDLQVDEESYIVSAEATVDMTFMRILGYDTMTVAARSVIQRELRGIEVALVLDNTGSMWSGSGGTTNIRALKNAARDFVTILHDRITEEGAVRIALVPYAAMVNPGPVAPLIVTNPYVTNWLNTAYAPYDPNDTSAWRGCVYERPYPHDIQDTSIAAGGYWTPFRWADTLATPSGALPAENNWLNTNGTLNLSVPGGSPDSTARNSNYWRHPNMGCPTPIRPLSDSRSGVLADIELLSAWNRGGTMGNIGLAWGVRVLSPETPFTEGAPFDDEATRKIIVMMTDGNNEIYCQPDGWSGGCTDARSDDTAYGRVSGNRLGTTSRSGALAEVNRRMTEACTYAKAQGITLYTITFATSLNNTTRDLYRNCASDVTKYFNAPTQADLQNVYSQIARELSNLHIRE